MANQINLDRSQRVDITCKRGDTFNLNLELKDDSNVALVLGDDQDDNLDDYYFYKMEVREADTHDGLGGPGTNNGYVLSIDGDVSSDSNGLVTFTEVHGNMGGDNLDAGIYVYDIQQKIAPNANGTSPSSVETLLYGIFKVVEDVTVAV